MLDKLVIHLKNIIFLKLIIYVITIILLAILLPVVQEELVRAASRKRKAQDFLAQANTQLNSIANFEEQIAETNLKYKELVNNPGKKGCEDRTNLIKDLAALSEKRKLFEPIKIEISRLFEANSVRNKNSEIKLNDYEAIISFKVHTYEEATDIGNDISALFPSGALVFSATIKKLEALNPEIIDKLSTTGFPGLINVTIKVILREIVYVK